MRKRIATIFLLAVFTLPLFAMTAFAQSGVGTVISGIDQSASRAGLSTGVGAADLPAALGRAINYLFGLMGVILLTVVLIGGYIWMTAGGNEEKVGKGKMFISNGINGMIVMFLAYALVWAILQSLKAAVGA